MRDYGKVSPQFWIGETGKKMRKAGPEAQVVALYLMTCPHSNMIGLYYLPIMYIGHETGLGIEGASKGLERAIEAGFCSYDEASEVVWVHEMAKFQIGDHLSEGDKRCKGVQNEYDSVPENPYLERFFARYKGAFHMIKMRPTEHQSTSPIEAPSESLASQEQEQEQEQEHMNNTGVLFVASPADDLEPAEPGTDKPTCPHKAIIALYHEILPTSPEIRDWTPNRAAALRTRWNEAPERQNLDWWRRFFGYVAESDFLTGKRHSADRKPFCAPLEWILKAENFAKIREGRYHQEAA
ncbi:hypothetical protein ABRY94_11845 [Castellaniella ginsengisoli]|uniref:DNA-binding protein n=1 Tax=Castellaniella ginsengisoli TaxID=546114 RepID=A0AB39EQW4_9BURK